MIIFPSNRLLEVLENGENWDSFPKDKIMVIEVDKIIAVINSALLCHPSSIITIISSGDPLFFGIGRKIIGEFGRDMVEILPDLSSIQLAFSRIKETWDDAFLMSLHGISDSRRLGYGMNDVPLFLVKYNKMAILTDSRENTPCAIAKILIDSPITVNLGITMFVCERLGYADEKITEGKPQEFIDVSFAEPNVVIVKIDTEQGKKCGATLYAIGVGPGDPELLTLKAVRILSEIKCICVPKGKEEGNSLALSIVEGALNLEGKEIIPAYFPMKKTTACHGEMDTKWQETAETIMDRINKGMSVAFITLGDPTLYSTFFYLYDRLLELNPGLNIQIIPGVSSINAAASRAGIPLGLADEKVAILPANYVDNLEETLQRFDTVILMKVHKVFDSIRKTLGDMGILDRAMYISRAGMIDERIFNDLNAVKAEDLDYFSMMIVKAGRRQING